MCFNTSSLIVHISHSFFIVHIQNMHFTTHTDRHGPNITGVPGDFNVCIFCYSGSRSINEAMLSTCSLSSLSVVCQTEHPKKKHSETGHIGVWQCDGTEPHPCLHPVCVTPLVRHLYFSTCACLSSSRAFVKENYKVCFSWLPPLMSSTAELRC